MSSKEVSTDDNDNTDNTDDTGNTDDTDKTDDTDNTDDTDGQTAEFNGGKYSVLLLEAQ